LLTLHEHRNSGRNHCQQIMHGFDGTELAMKYVVKLGDSILEDPRLLHNCILAIIELVRHGHQVTVVHGGGTALSRTLALLGKQTEFVSGSRFTDAETRDTAVMVLGGQVNKTLVAALASHGQSAVGLTGADGLLFRARRKRTTPDLGYVGEIVDSDVRWIYAIWQLAAVPVISSIALGLDGEYYTVSSDEMAGACAIATNADELVFLTGLPGVRAASGEIIRWLRVDDIDQLTRDKVVTGHMLPKLRAGREALLRGVTRVCILPADAARLVPDLASIRSNFGTEVTNDWRHFLLST
jgi:acetylglutamate kinase